MQAAPQARTHARTHARAALGSRTPMARTEPLPNLRQAWKKDQGLAGSEMVEFLADKDGPLTNALEP